MADPVAPSAPLPFPDAAKWRTRIDAARQRAKDRVLAGRQHLERYLQSYADTRTTRSVQVLHDFFYTEQKTAQLVYSVPETYLTSKRPDADAAAPLFATVLNDHALSAKGVKAQDLIDKMIFDIVCPLGFAVCHIGYEAHTTEIPDPNWVAPPAPAAPEGFFAGAIAGVKNLFAPQEAPTAPMVPVVVSSRIFSDPIPGGRFLHPQEWISGSLDEAPWCGYDYYEISKDGRAGNAEEQDTLLVPSAVTGFSPEPRRRVNRTWYRAIVFDETAHPDEIRFFEWADGDRDPRKHEPFAGQTPNPDGTLGGMRGYPLSLLRIRTISDASIPPSDIAIIRNGVDELSVGRTQLLERRDRNLPQTALNTAKLGAPFRDNLEQNRNTAFIPVTQPIEPGDITPIDKGTFGRETMEFQNVTERDLDRAMGLGANQTGVQGRSKPTATEASIIQSNTDTRLDKERQKIMAWWCEDYVPKVAATVQKFYTQKDYTYILGEENAARVMQFVQQDFQQSFCFTVQAGASLRRDANAERKRWLDLYNLTANDPYINRAEITRNLCKSYGLDPAAVLQKPPDPKPEKPKVSVSIKVEDFSGPAADIAKKIYNGEPLTDDDWLRAQANQMLVTEQAQQQELAEQQAEHGGPAQQAEPISKHPMAITGRLPGMGAATGEAVGGMMR